MIIRKRKHRAAGVQLTTPEQTHAEPTTEPTDLQRQVARVLQLNPDDVRPRA